MKKDTTAMEDMILWMEKYNMDCTSKALREAKRLLSKERQQMIELASNAFDAGIKNGENNVFFNKVKDLNEDAPIKSTWIKNNFPNA